MNDFKEEIGVFFDVINPSPTLKYNVLVLIEPPEVLDIIRPVIDVHQRFDLILTWNEEILRSCPNSIKFPFGSCWIDEKTFIPNKKNEISFVTSSKAHTPLHKFRLMVSDYLVGVKLNHFDIKTHRSPPFLPSKHSFFESAKYSIVVENSIRPNWFTEKLIDCLATRTVPIYRGCPNIGEYFDIGGMMEFNSVEELDRILRRIDDDDPYETMGPSIEQNFEKFKRYSDFHRRVKDEIRILINERTHGKH